MYIPIYVFIPLFILAVLGVAVIIATFKLLFGETRNRMYDKNDIGNKW